MLLATKNTHKETKYKLLNTVVQNTIKSVNGAIYLDDSGCMLGC